MTTLSTKQKQFLKGLAHHLSPVVMLGGNGLTEGVLAEIDNALNHHELIKVKIAGADRETKQLIIDAIVRETKSSNVQTIGHILVLYRPSEEGKIQLAYVIIRYPSIGGMFLDVIYFNNLELNRSTWCGNIHGIIQLFPYQATSNR